MKKFKVLFIYNLPSFPTIDNIWQHIRAFHKYSEEKIYYVNSFYSKFPKYLEKVNFDIVIFHQTFNNQWYPERFYKNLKLLKNFNFHDAVKIAFFQDEYHHTDLSCQLINELGVQYVYSVTPESEWKIIYDKVDFKKVKFFRSLTAYIKNDYIQEINKLSNKISKDIDIGYRTGDNGTYKTGRFGMIKKDLADAFKQKATEKGVNADISRKNKDMFLGNKWIEFLLRCKYTLGIEGGSSLLDRNGQIMAKISNYLRTNPKASFNEVENACFPGVDGNIAITALSPRHFEACMTRTCQILVEGDYNGILKPWKHYIPLNKDFSNIDEIIKLVKEDKLRKKITKQAYEDIILANKYSYDSFIEDFFKSITKNKIKRKNFTKKDQLYYYRATINDKLNYIKGLLFGYMAEPVYNQIAKKITAEKVNRLLVKFGW